MALIIYPDEGYDSFVTVIDATGYIDRLTMHGPAWAALEESDQEVYLRIACRNIEDGINLTVLPLPDPAPLCLGESQSLMAVQDVVYGFSASTTTSTAQVKKQKVSTLEVEYFETASGTTEQASLVPDMAMPCLVDLGYTSPSSMTGLKQTTLGRS